MNPYPYVHSIFEPQIKVEQDYYERPEVAQKEEKKGSKLCTVCGKTLSSPSSYYVHMKKHSGHKPYHCTTCTACFSRKPYLEAHLRTHTGEKPFECDVCKKRFSQKSSLNTHKRVHTGLRPYVCNVCGKNFAIKNYLSSHQWCHVSEDGLVCPTCQLSFNSRYAFIQHVKTHSQVFDCKLCRRGFAKEAYLLRHCNKVHYLQEK